MGPITAALMAVGGILLVVKGADYLVEGSGSVARRFGVKPIVIGLTVVAFGTSMPELVVNLVASFQDAPGLAIGNIVGSNISNILLILGVAAVFHALTVQRNTVTKEIPFALLSAVVLLIMVWDGVLDRADGLVLLCFFIIFLYYTFGISKVQGEMGVGEIPKFGAGKSIALISAGIFGLAVGGKLTVDGAETFGILLGISDAIIGLTVVAVGTSLPELATSVVAARKGEVDIAIGNVIGSNIFNVFWVLGLSSTIRSIPFTTDALFDVLVAIAATLVLLAALFIGKRNILEKWEGWMLMGLYASYIVFLIFRHVASA